MKALFMASVALASSSPAHHHGIPGCQRTYTVHMDVRAIDATFRGTKNVTAGEMGRLHHYFRCTRNPRAQAYLHYRLRKDRQDWSWRRNPPLYGPVIASWYDDSGETGCGFHAANGIAALNVPCGARVLLAHGGNQVVAVRDDSGPYVGGRTFDLSPGVKAQLGCDDLCSVLYRVVG